MHEVSLQSFCYKLINIWIKHFGGPVHGGMETEFFELWKIPKITYREGREEDV